MVALQILVLPVQVRVLISQQNPCKSLQNNKIQKSLLKNGTETGHLAHSADNLYEATLFKNSRHELRPVKAGAIC